MSVVFYGSVIRGLSFSHLRSKIDYTHKTIKRALSVLYSDKTRRFDQSELAEGLVFITNLILRLSRFAAVCKRTSLCSLRE